MQFGRSESKFLKKEDLESGPGQYMSAVVNIDRVAEENVARADEDPEHKFILYFQGKTKGMVLNTTNMDAMISAHGMPQDLSSEGATVHFRGKSLIVYVDPEVRFGGKKVGGLRLRGAENAPAQPPPPTDADAPPPDDASDLPF